MTKQKRRRRAEPADPAELADQRRADAITVGWMLCVMATLLAELVGASLHLLLRSTPAPPDAPGPLSVLPGLMVFTAMITGLVSLLLLPLVYRFRRIPPPPAITAFAVIVALLPWIAMFF